MSEDKEIVRNESEQGGAEGGGDQGEVVSSGRRRFVWTVGGLGLVWAAAGAYPIYRYLSPQPAPDPFGEDGKAVVEGVSPNDVANSGMGKNGGYANRGVIVFRAQDGNLRAFDSKCTHAGCNVEYQRDKLYCHCHGGTYDLTGRNIAGPPPRPLTELTCFEEEGVIYVSRKGPDPKKQKS